MRRSVVVLYMRDIWGLMYTERTYTENRMDEWIEWMADNTNLGVRQTRQRIRKQ